MKLSILLLIAQFAVVRSFAPSPAKQASFYRHQTSCFSVEEELETAVAQEASSSEETFKEPVKCPDCDLCDGSGRILGGIATVLTWWPIKAYRPCPNFVARGGTYIRAGQGLDEIAFGRGNVNLDSKE